MFQAGRQGGFLAAGAGGECTDLTDVHGNRSWNEDDKETDEFAASGF